MLTQQLHSLDGPAGLRLVEAAPPVPRPGELLVGVEAAGVCFPDLLYTYGRYQDVPQLPFVPGVEVAGTVLSASAHSRFREGDRVMAVTWFGGWAEQVAVADHLVMPLPSEFTPAQGAGFLLNYQTAYFCLVTRGRLRPGERVLVHGAAGGLGSAAIQVINGLGGQSIAVVSTEGKADIARAAGAGSVVVVSDRWSEQVQATTDGRGVDLVFDPVGGGPERLSESLRSMRRLGRYLVVGFADGAIPTIALNRLLLRNVEVIGAAWGPFIQESPAHFAEIGTALQFMAENGALTPIVGARFPLEEAPGALQAIEERRAVGKVVLDVPGRGSSRSVGAAS